MTIFTRDELYDLVWNEPLRLIAPRFGMSDVAFRKHCVAANVPLPERGYWAKIAAGKPASKVRLPRRELGASQTISVAREPYSWNPDPDARLAGPIPERPAFQDDLADLRAWVARRLGRVKYVRDLSSVHGNLRKIMEAEAKRAPAFQKTGWSWDRPKFESGFERRRLCLLNSLALGLAKMGGRLEIRGQTARELNVLVGSTRVALRLDPGRQT